jgi:hypothetical protein
MHKKETKLCPKCKTKTYIVYRNQNHKGLCSSCTGKLPDYMACIIVFVIPQSAEMFW